MCDVCSMRTSRGRPYRSTAPLQHNIHLQGAPTVDTTFLPEGATPRHNCATARQSNGTDARHAPQHDTHVATLWPVLAPPPCGWLWRLASGATLQLLPPLDSGQTHALRPGLGLALRALARVHSSLRWLAIVQRSPVAPATVHRAKGQSSEGAGMGTGRNCSVDAHGTTVCALCACTQAISTTDRHFRHIKGFARGLQGPTAGGTSSAGGGADHWLAKPRRARVAWRLWCCRFARSERCRSRLGLLSPRRHQIAPPQTPAAPPAVHRGCDQWHMPRAVFAARSTVSLARSCLRATVRTQCATSAPHLTISRHSVCTTTRHNALRQYRC